MIRKSTGRPSSIPNEPSLQTEIACSTKSLRWSTEPYIKALCIICQKRKTSEDTHKVKTTRKVLRMLQVATETEDKILKMPSLMTLFITSHVGFTNSAKLLKMKERSMKIIMTRRK